MNPADFPEANAHFNAPKGMDESQVFTIHAMSGTIHGGTLDGEKVVVTAWAPTPEELEQLNKGRPLFFSFIGGLPPHYATTDYVGAANPGVPLVTACCFHCGERNSAREDGWQMGEVRELICRNCGLPWKVTKSA